VAGSARFGFFHLSHGKAAVFSQIKQGIVTYLAVIFILFEVDVMTEDNRISVLEPELDVFGFLGGQQKRCAQEGEKGEDGDTKLHGALLVQ
jgi:hypothetical protein